MSRSYAFKPELKKTVRKPRADRKVVLTDYDIESIELSVGPDVQLRV